MKRFLALTALTLTGLGLGAPAADASHRREARIVDAWYHRYLGRCPEPAGLNHWIHALRCLPPATALGQLLASEEYYHRNGCCPEGFVRGLYRDVLSRTDVCRQDLEFWLARLRQCGCRQRLACEFLRHHNVDVLACPAPAPPSYPAYAPAPIVSTPAPAYYPPPPPRPASGFSLRIRF